MARFFRHMISENVQVFWAALQRGDPPFTFTTVEDGAADDVRTSLRLTLPHVGVSSSDGHSFRVGLGA